MTKTKHHQADFCVVGGGMAGLCAALAAARHGARTVLVQDRPVLGGNASGEIRMWICGAHGDNNHETGILEEILLENQWRNNAPTYSLWDSVLYEKARFQKNLTLLLNTPIHEVETEGNRILRVRGRQMTTEVVHTIEAALFADCTGDGFLGAQAGAEFRVGREARTDYDESIAPEKGDKKTMGLSCLIQARETDRFQPFTPPAWAYKYTSDGALPNRDHCLTGDQNFWWLEVGGLQDSIADTEELRDELLKIAFGIWDHIKNRGDHGADNWILDWVGFLPGKRESRRFVGDHTLTQNDVEAEGRHFDDVVAYGGWTMDDHFPEGFYKKEAGTIFHAAPSPYAIPYRCLYSRNLENLFFAGRNISATHAALSSTRVMATCSLLGQAVGTAAALATQHQTTPRGVLQRHLGDLQSALQWDDAYLPFRPRVPSVLTRLARFSANQGDADALRNGWDRQIGDARNSWDAGLGDQVTLEWPAAADVRGLRLVFDSDLSRTTHNMVSYYTLAPQNFSPPAALVRSFCVEYRDAQGTWTGAVQVPDNHQRLVWVDLNLTTTAVRVRFDATWGAPGVRVFALDAY